MLHSYRSYKQLYRDFHGYTGQYSTIQGYTQPNWAKHSYTGLYPVIHGQGLLRSRFLFFCHATHFSPLMGFTMRLNHGFRENIRPIVSSPSITHCKLWIRLFISVYFWGGFGENVHKDILHTLEASISGIAFIPVESC